MFRHGKNLVMVILFVVVPVLMGRPVAAQTYWMWPGNDNSVSLEVLKPNFNHYLEGYRARTTVWFLSGRFEVTGKLSIFVDLPLVFSDYSGYLRFGGVSPNETETQIGNPYIGIESSLTGQNTNHTITGRLGVRPPLTSDEKTTASLVGLLTTYDRSEAFTPDMWAFTGGFGYSRTLESGLTFSANVEDVLLIPTEEGENHRLFIDYNLGLWLTQSNVSLGAGFNGRWLTTEPDRDDYWDFGETTVYQLGFVGKYNFGDFSPGLHLRVPLDNDIGNFVDYVFGFNLTFDIDK